MSNLVRYNSNGIELVINQETGAAYATQAGYLRMSGKAKSTISERVAKGFGAGNIVGAEINTPGGLQGVRLIPADLVFEWLMKDNPELAKAMGSAGATVYMHQLAGFKVSSDAITPSQPPRQLPPPHVQVTDLYAALSGFGIDLDNPRYKQALQDITLDILGVSRTSQAILDLAQGTLPPSQGAWVGVVERAEQLGYSVALVASQRSKLGKYVKSSGLEPTQELRLCNGTQRMVNVYPVCPQLDSVIREFFEGQ